MIDIPAPTPEVWAQFEGIPCVIVGHPTASGVYDGKGNCVVPFRFTRPDGVLQMDTNGKLHKAGPNTK